MKNKTLIDQKKICEFVNAVEAKKKFRRDSNYVFRHMISEMGELDRAMWNTERFGTDRGDEPKDHALRTIIGFELLDVIFLACYMAEIYGIELNDLIRLRMLAISKEYDVKWPL